MRLIIEDLEGSTTVVNLGNEDVTIGRKPHNTIQLTEQNVSRSHAKLSFRDDGWLIQDLSSYNGVKVNGVPIATPTLLRESDLIQIGDYHLTLTDDVDRATVDIERPRYPANDPYAAGAAVGMMSSSNDLPSVSVEDLQPRHGPGPVGYAQPQPMPREEERSKTGMIIGIIGVVAALIGIVAFLSMKGGDEDKKPAGESGGQQAATNDKADTPAPTPPPEPPPSTTTTGPEPVPEVDTGAPVDTGEPPPSDDSAGEIVPEPPPPEPEPEPEPPPTEKPKQQQPKQTKPKLPPDQALAEARKASLSGNNSKAYSLAKEAYDQNQSGDALNLMGVAACKMGSASKAKAAHKKMTAKDKAMLEKLCGSLGIEL